MIAADLSLATFWCGVAVGSIFLLGHLVGWEWETRQRLRAWDRVEQACRLERKRVAADLERARVRAVDLSGWLVECPAGAISGVPHAFTPGTGVRVPWDILGDPRGSVVVCRECAGRGQP